MACVLPEHGCNLYFSVSAMKHAIKVFSSNHFLFQQQRSLKTLTPRPPGHFGDNALRMNSGIVRQVSGISLGVIWKDSTSLWISHTTAPPCPPKSTLATEAHCVPAMVESPSLLPRRLDTVHL